jgi:glyoxylase-like metal-dependent hydrolase (beta-lactamase superfamily II)
MGRSLPSEQVAGVYRRNVGDIKVATVNDGLCPTAFEHIVGADPALCEQAHRSSFRAVPPWLTLNTFLIETAGHLMLVDAGFADTLPETGRLLPNLAALDVSADDIDAVLVTHLHRDHDAGLIDRTGMAVFKNAELIVHDDELAFWRDESNLSRLTEMQKPDFPLATSVLRAYRNRVHGVSTGEVAPGVTPVPTPGHTPGHTAWHIASGSDQLLIWGDVIHLPGIQFAIPCASVLYDIDSQAAAVTRKRVLDMVATDHLLVAGIHLDFPAFGRVVADGPGRYSYAADVWLPVL